MLNLNILYVYTDSLICYVFLQKIVEMVIDLRRMGSCNTDNGLRKATKSFVMCWFPCATRNRGKK